MAGRFVRASKYRHVFGRPTKKEQCYDNLRISKNAWDTNLVKANPSYISVNWEASGGGAFAVIPLEERGKLPEQIPLFRGHTAAVLDTDWSPFNDSLIASGSDDAKIFIWKVPDNFTLHSDAEEPQDVGPVSRFSGHSRKVGHVLFNSAAANVLASSSGDYTVKIWDIEAGASKLTLKHGDIVQSLSWSADGSMLVTTGRDKKLRLWDVRQEKPAYEGTGHPGAKASRAVWMGEHDRIATTGFSRMSDRQLGLWDTRNPKEPVNGFSILDQISGVCMPFWDDGTSCLYLAGKGDGNIRYYEYENDKFEYLSEYKSADPQRGVAFLPKRGINLHENEVVRAYKTVADQYIEPVSFVVPRRAEVFQGDIYPPTTGIRPGTSANDWFDGKTALPPKIDLESVYEGSGITEVPADYKPATTAATPQRASPVKTEAQKAPPKAEPMPQLSKPTSAGVGDNKASISAAASKFADSAEDNTKDDDDSSFEEIPKPAERPSVLAARAEEKSRATTVAKPKDIERSGPPAVSQVTPAKTEAPSASNPALATASTSSSTTTVPTTTPSSGTGGPAEGLRMHLQDIRDGQARLMAMLESQNRMMQSQSEQIAALSEEVDTLKGKVGSSSGGRDERDEKIRRLELELEEMRS